MVSSEQLFQESEPLLAARSVALNRMILLLRMSHAPLSPGEAGWGDGRASVNALIRMHVCASWSSGGGEGGGCQSGVCGLG